jgi:hypothetical protein
MIVVSLALHLNALQRSVAQCGAGRQGAIGIAVLPGHTKLI